MTNSLTESAVINAKVLSTGFVLAFFSFVIPFVLPSPQIIVGSVVNALLFISAVKLGKKNWLAAVIVLPSVATFLRGLIFGPLTIFLFYFLPFIWAGNWVLISVFRKAYEKSFFGAVILSALAKTSLLFLAANFYTSLKVAPAIFLKSMGLFQFGTALFGGLLAFIFLRIFRKSNG